MQICVLLSLSNSALEVFVDPGFYVRVREEGSSNPPGRRRMTYAIKAPGSPKIHQPVRIQDFPEGGAPTPNTAIILQLVCRKLHQNERIWTGGASLVPPLDPPMPMVYSDEYLTAKLSTKYYKAVILFRPIFLRFTC